MMPNSVIKRLLKKAGAKRVGKDAIKKLKRILEEKGLLIARKAVKNAEYSGRKSVRAKDIKENRG